MHSFPIHKAIGIMLGGFVIFTGTALLSAPHTQRTKPTKKTIDAQPLISFVRPGLALKLQSAKIASDGTIKAQFTVSDHDGLPLDLNGIVTPGQVTVQLVAATIPKGQSQYVTYTTHYVGPPLTQNSGNLPHADIGGVFQKVADGLYEYTFATKAPVGYDPAATHAIGAFSSRDLTEFGYGKQNSSDVFTFVPNGSAVSVTRDAIRSASCNQCHTAIAYHDGTRQGLELCVLCHTPQNRDLNTGETLDLRSLIHKIHTGTDLDSVQNGASWVISTDDFTNSQDYSIFEPVTQPRDCQHCHQPGPSQADNWKINPTRAACGSCHDTTNLATGDNHAGGPQFDDNQCKNCHIPQGELPLDASVVGAHVIPAYSVSFPGVVFQLLRVDNAAPGKNPTIVFTVKDKSGNAIQPTSMDRLALVVAGPTTDYGGWVQEDARGARGASDGTLSYTFQRPLPANAAGTFTVGIEGYRLETLLPGTEKATQAPDVGDNKMLNFSVDGSALQPRRTIVSVAKCYSCHQPQPECNTCHSQSLHNGNRNQFDYCVLCHNPNETDQAQRPSDDGLAQSMDFAGLIHKIHTGENRTWQTIYGIGGVADAYDSVRFPSDLGKCDLCHVNGSEQLPMPSSLLPVQNPAGPINPMGRATEACLGCHDSNIATVGHALANTSQLGESCSVCHGPGTDFAVDKVHAQ